METLVVVAEHRNQYYGGSKSQVSDRFGPSPSKNFKDITCRFQSGAGILPNPLKSCNSSSPNTQQSVSPPSHSGKHFKINGKSKAIPINLKAFDKDKPFNDDLSYSELWAGPAYSLSPPPSSLPIPKFSLQPKRSVSLELPVLASEFKMLPVAKSAPPSPRREPLSSPRNFILNTASATEDLRRILHLDLRDE